MLPAAVTTLQALTGVDLVMIADLSGKVIAAPTRCWWTRRCRGRELAGRARPLPLRRRSRSGAPRYLMAAVPILSDPDARRAGTSAGHRSWSGQQSPTRLESLASAAPALLTYLGAALLLGVGGSLLLARWIKRGTLGMEPAEIAALAEQREAIFAGIAEGIIALDTHHRITRGQRSRRSPCCRCRPTRSGPVWTSWRSRADCATC